MDCKTHNGFQNGVCKPSIYSYEQRKKLLLRDFKSGTRRFTDRIAVRPFPLDVDFLVTEESARWLFNERKVAKIRAEWKRSGFTFKQDGKSELLERQRAAQLINSLSSELFL